jgi:cobyrinic acid a,c-diamide synthase
MQLESLSSNQSLLADIKLKIEQGLPTYAECGGLMYLSQTITHQGKSHQMVGVIGSLATLIVKLLEAITDTGISTDFFALAKDKILSKSTWSAIIRAALLINC